MGAVVENRGASLESIRNVFLHVLNAYRYWFKYAINNNLKEYVGIDMKAVKSVDDMRRHEMDVDSMVTLLLGTLHEEDLSKAFAIQADDVTYHVTMQAILMHMIEEELQHRGEINCMFWQMDIDPPIIEYGQWLGQRVEL